MSSNLKVSCFIPIKKDSKRVPGKNFKKIGKKKLYEIGIQKAIASKCFDSIYVDTDSLEIQNYCRENGVNYIERLDYLRSDTANGNHLLDSWINRKPKYDIYCQFHITCPFIEVSSIRECVNKVKIDKYNSSLTAVEEKSWYWFDKNPVNYIPEQLPRSQDAKGVVRETTSLYVIEKDEFLRHSCRIGSNPYFHLSKNVEGIDIDNPIDLFIAQNIHTWLGEKND